MNCQTRKKTAQQQWKEVGPIAIRIITDSTCDLSVADSTRMNIQVVPLSVHFGGASFLDGVDISMSEFYRKLEQEKDLPTTSQVPPETFRGIFSAHVAAGDEVVGIFLSDEISGTYRSACIARDELGSDKVHIIDSRSATMSLALLVWEAAKYRDAGHSATEIVEHVSGLVQRVRFVAAINTLKYLRRGGRIPAVTAIAGELMGIKPIVSIVGGFIHTIDKARGMPAAIKTMLQHTLADLPDLRYDVIFAHAEAPELLKAEISCFEKPLQLTNWLVCNIGSVIGTYAGKGAVGFSYIAKSVTPVAPLRAHK